MERKYDVAAYIWPAYTGDEPRTKLFWPEGIGEWAVGKKRRIQVSRTFLAQKIRVGICE